MKVLKFGAVWCPGCIVMKPRWAKVEKENAWLESAYFDFDESSVEVEKYKVGKGRLPAFIFLDKDGKEIDRMTGEISEQKIVSTINNYKNR